MSAKRPIRVWPAPIFLGVISTVGLISALLSDGLGDYLAWLTLGIPVAICLWYAPPRRTAKQEPATDASTAAEHSELVLHRAHPTPRQEHVPTSQ